MIAEVKHCQKCGSEHIVKNDSNASGNPKYKYKTCGLAECFKRYRLLRILKTHSIQIIRPLTAKWHKLSLQSAFKEPSHFLDFRQELEVIRPELIIYARLLSDDIAGVENLITLENES